MVAEQHLQGGHEWRMNHTVSHKKEVYMHRLGRRALIASVGYLYPAWCLLPLVHARKHKHNTQKLPYIIDVSIFDPVYISVFLTRSVIQYVIPEERRNRNMR